MASAFPPASLRPILKEVAELLKQRKETISVAETVRPDHNLTFLLSLQCATG